MTSPPLFSPRRFDQSSCLTPKPKTSGQLRPPPSVTMSILRSVGKALFKQDDASVLRRHSLELSDDDFESVDEGGIVSESVIIPEELLIRAMTYVSPVPFSTWQEQIRILEEVQEQISLRSEKAEKPIVRDSLITFLDEVLTKPLKFLGYELAPEFCADLNALKELLTQKTEDWNIEHNKESAKRCSCAACVIDQGYKDLLLLQKEQFETLHHVGSTFFYQEPPEEYEVLVEVLHFTTRKDFEGVERTLSKEEGKLFSKAFEVLDRFKEDEFAKEFKSALESVMQKNQLCLIEGAVKRFENLQAQLEERFPNIGIFYKLKRFVEVEFVQLFSKTVEGCIAQHPQVEMAEVYLILLEVQRGQISKEKLQRVSDVLGRLDQFAIAIERGEKNCLEALQKEISGKLGEEPIGLDSSRLSDAIGYLNTILRRNEGVWQSMQRDMRTFAQDMTRSAAQDVATIFEQKFQEELTEPPKELLEIQQVLQICSQLTLDIEVELSSQNQALFSRVAKDLSKKRKDAPNGEKATYGSMADFLRAHLNGGKIKIPRDQLVVLQKHLVFMDQKVQEHTGLAMQFGQKMGQIFETTAKATASDLTKAAPIGLLNIVRALRIAIRKEEFSSSEKVLIQLAKEEEKNLEQMSLDEGLKKEMQAVLRLLDTRGINEDQKPKLQKLLIQLETRVLPAHQGVLTTAMQQISGQFAEQFIASLENTGLLSTLKNVGDISERLTEMSKDVKGVTEDLKSVIDFIKTPLRMFMWALIPMAFVALIGGFWLTKIYIERKYPVPVA